MPVVKGLSAVQSTTKCKESDFEYLETMAQSAGFEPATVRLEGGCSILLSYYDNSCNTTKLIIMEVVLESQSEI